MKREFKLRRCRSDRFAGVVFAAAISAFCCSWAGAEELPPDVAAYYAAIDQEYQTEIEHEVIHSSEAAQVKSRESVQTDIQNYLNKWRDRIEYSGYVSGEPRVVFANWIEPIESSKSDASGNAEFTPVAVRRLCYHTFVVDGSIQPCVKSIEEISSPSSIAKSRSKLYRRELFTRSSGVFVKAKAKDCYLDWKTMRLVERTEGRKAWDRNMITTVQAEFDEYGLQPHGDYQ